jgi:hypothetical protein
VELCIEDINTDGIGTRQVMKQESEVLKKETQGLDFVFRFGN